MIIREVMGWVWIRFEGICYPWICFLVWFWIRIDYLLGLIIIIYDRLHIINITTNVIFDIFVGSMKNY